jgi:hypothetical protein
LCRKRHFLSQKFFFSQKNGARHKKIKKKLFSSVMPAG